MYKPLPVSSGHAGGVADIEHTTAGSRSQPAVLRIRVCPDSAQAGRAGQGQAAHGQEPQEDPRQT